MPDIEYTYKPNLTKKQINKLKAEGWVLLGTLYNSFTHVIWFSFMRERT